MTVDKANFFAAAQAPFRKPGWVVACTTWTLRRCHWVAGRVKQSGVGKLDLHLGKPNYVF